MRLLQAAAFGLVLSAAPVSAQPVAHEVTGYHGGPDRSGNFVMPALTWQRAATAQRDPGFDGHVNGPVYAQPLYWSSGGSGQRLVIVATELNEVDALDAETGRTVWRKALGAPMPRSALPCGNIDPLGITGTPAIDPRTQALFLDAMVREQGQPHHFVFGLSLKDGSVLPGWPVDVALGVKAVGQTFESGVQNERGAVAVVNGRVYVPYGGHFGDCGDYHGWVVGFDIGKPRVFAAWATRGTAGGIWGQGGVVSDGKALFVATGNTIGMRRWGDGDAVIRLPLDLHRSTDPRDYFAPSNWAALDEADADLGGTNPMLINLPGNSGQHSLLLALGKDGKAYLLNRDNLGGIGGALAEQPVSAGPIRTGPAEYPSSGGVLVAFQGPGAACPNGVQGDLTVLRVTSGTRDGVSTAWCGAMQGRGSPIVTTTDGHSDPVVWIAGAEGDDLLHGFRGDTGHPVFTGGGSAGRMKGLSRFVTILAADDRLYVAGNGRVYAFRFGIGH